MIVDDSELMRKEIIRSVAYENDIVLECDSGKSAINLYSDFHPDWILMDIKMKNMNGLIAAEKIKMINPNVKIAMVSSYDNYYYRQAAKSLGVEFYFLKTNLLDIRETLKGIKI
jgi:YesN/AraC family two-component response regulator